MLGKKRIYIYMACPGCLEEYGEAPMEYWRHGGRCQGYLMLDEYANVICEKGDLALPLTQMQLSCDRGLHKLIVPDVSAHTQAITCAAAFVNNMGMAWLRSVITYLEA